MNRAVIAIADQVMVQELRARLDEVEQKVEVVYVADSVQEMVTAVLAHRPTLVFVHDRLGPGPVTRVIRDLALRNPSLAVLLVSADEGAEAYSAALESGARGVLAYPFALEDINTRIASVLEWSETLRAVVSENADSTRDQSAFGARVVAVAGAKGGVGTTVLAAHLAWDVAVSDRDIRVCLVDLDVEKGDIPSYIDVSHRVSLADLAKISQDLTSRAVADTVVVHASGLHLLLAPTEIRDTELIAPEAVRQVLAQLRSLYHLVILDVGAAVTTTQAAAVESADVVVQVVTTDVPALRAARRQVLAWESLGVSEPGAAHVVVNRFERRSEIQQDTVDQLVIGTRSQVLIPDLGFGLERAANSRTPSEVRDHTWWRSLRAIGAELEVTGVFHTAQAQAARQEQQETAQAPLTRSAVKRQSRGRLSLRRDTGQATLENVFLVPFALGVLVLGMQAVLMGIAFVVAGLGGTAAARAASLGLDPTVAARQAVPSGMWDDLTVSSSGDRVSVRVRTPLMMAHGVTRDVTIDTSHRVTTEPRGMQP